MKHHPTIDGVTYTTKVSLTNAVQAKMASLTRSNQLRKLPLDAFWTDFLANGQQIIKKAAVLCPDEFIEFGYRGNSTGHAVLCLYDRRNPLRESSIHEVSYRKVISYAFDPKFDDTPERVADKFNAACRTAIVTQIDAYRESQRLSNGRFICVDTGDELAQADIHIDHHPIQFAQIVADWDLSASDFKLADFEDYEGEGQMAAFKYPEIATLFADHHATYQNNLRVVHKTINLTKKREQK